MCGSNYIPLVYSELIVSSSHLKDSSRQGLAIGLFVWNYDAFDCFDGHDRFGSKSMRYEQDRYLNWNLNLQISLLQ